jgi:hypothetical protein
VADFAKVEVRHHGEDRVLAELGHSRIHHCRRNALGIAELSRRAVPPRHELP